MNDPSSGQYTLNLMNKGIGPAIVEKVSIQYRNQEYDLDPREFTINYLDSISNNELWYDGSNLYEGIIIPAVSKIPLISTKVLPDNQENPIITLFYHNHAKVVIHYSSIYGTVWKLEGTGDIPDVDPDFNPIIFRHLFEEN